MTVEIIELSREQLSQAQDRIVAIYRTVFAEPPYSKSKAAIAQFTNTVFPRHVQRAGFRCVVAWAQNAGIVGFAYGYTSSAGQWWHDAVAQALGPHAAAEWLKDSFEFVELALLPSARGRGIGGRLHDTLLRNLPHQMAILSTAQQETTAYYLYRKRGWQTLLGNFIFPGGTLPYRIMGLKLKNDSR
jgi:GNAT superfamily N-acetyltransferase